MEDWEEDPGELGESNIDGLSLDSEVNEAEDEMGLPPSL